MLMRSMKFLIAIIWDFLDFTLFRIPVFGSFTDILSIPLAVWLWGLPGILAFWEVFDITDQVDAQVPTMTLIGILTVIGGHK